MSRSGGKTMKEFREKFRAFQARHNQQPMSWREMQRNRGENIGKARLEREKVK